MTLSAERTAGSVMNQRPIRRPDAANVKMMTRRGWWLVILNFLIPGSAQALAGNRRLGRLGLRLTLVMWVLVVIAALGALLWRTAALAVVTFRFTLPILAVLLAVYAVVWVILSIDTLRLVRVVRTRAPQRFFILLLGLILAAVQAVTGVFGVSTLITSSGFLNDNFSNAAPVVSPSDGYYNVLLLGADSGEGRDSLRYDSISVISINADTGAITITGVPRDLEHAPFSEGSPMLAEYPTRFEGHADPECGWTSGINQLTNAVAFCREDGGESLYPDAEKHDSLPEVEATKDAVEGLTGLEIPYYVSIDMQGFAALIDAVGGVNITVDERLPEGGGPAYDDQPAEEWATGWIEKGEQKMNGETALWYARSRYTTSDWDRMQRQRELQTAVLSQMTPQNLLTRLEEVADAGTAVLDTDVPRALVPTFLDLAVEARKQEMGSVELNPDMGVDQIEPDVALIQQMVHDALHPATEAPAE